MPHVYLEYSAGVDDNVNAREAIQRLHQALVEVSGLRLDLWIGPYISIHFLSLNP